MNRSRKEALRADLEDALTRYISLMTEELTGVMSIIFSHEQAEMVIKDVEKSISEMAENLKKTGFHELLNHVASERNEPSH